jgi:hypothetical protein
MNDNIFDSKSKKTQIFTNENGEVVMKIGPPLTGVPFYEAVINGPFAAFLKDVKFFKNDDFATQLLFDLALFGSNIAEMLHISGSSKVMDPEGLDVLTNKINDVLRGEPRSKVYAAICWVISDLTKD